MLIDLKKIDWPLTIIVIILIITGILAIASTSILTPNGLLNLKKQTGFALVGILIMFFLASRDYRALKNYSGILYLLAIFLLIGVLVWGNKIRGTAGWFSFGIFGSQPVELAKIIVVIVLAKYLSLRSSQMHQAKPIIVSAIYAFIITGLVILQPDLGSAILIGLIWLGMILVAGIKYRYLVSLILIILLLGSLAWFGFFQDWQKARILTFVNPELDPLGYGYHARQAIIAVGSGGLFGKGLGQGTQSQLRFLPETQTDFIFAAIGEELGFIGTFIVIILFALLFWRLLKISFATPDNFAKLISVGIIILISSQLTINIGMNIGIVPITGIPLPFISYGGSALLALMLAMGILQSINANSKNSFTRCQQDKEFTFDNGIIS